MQSYYRFQRVNSHSVYSYSFRWVFLQSRKLWRNNTNFQVIYELFDGSCSLAYTVQQTTVLFLDMFAPLEMTTKGVSLDEPSHLCD